MNNAFRSHLMQQFMASARGQMRSPPVAVCGWLADSNNNNNNDGSDSVHAARLKHRRQFSNYPPMLQAENDSSPSILFDSNDISQVESSSSSHHDHTIALQTLLRTRRTTSHYRDGSSYNIEHYRSALDRAALAGRSAPNHKHTEAVSFRRILSPDAISKLADIAANVSHNPRKGDKWRKVPAFLVTLVHQETQQIREEDMSDDTDPYVPLPYTPPSTERELEDYAAACAATQNVLLSLHAEGLATKWATGPVIRTPAFRQLIDASCNDRVAALVFVGEAASETVYKRRYRREFHGDFLRDV